MLARSCSDIPNVVFDSFDGLLVDYMRKVDAGVILRGLRAVSDFENEFQMAQLNRQMNPQVETFFLMTSPEHAYLSSSAVREIAMFGGDVSGFVPAAVLDEVTQKLRK
jgi:pantetheine-phosphate adenylyltransferase